MFAFPPLSAAPPTSVQEAVLQAKRLFSQAGLVDAELVVTQPPEAGESLRGACLEATIPAASLEAVAAKAAEALGASQGVKISHTRLSLQNGGGSLSLELGLEVGVRVLGATVTLGLRGVAAGVGGEDIQCRELKLDAGSGLFSGMATAMIRPRLDALERHRFNLTQIAGVPVRLFRLECTGEAQNTLRIGLQFV
jgi:hypothetical protein